ncbi:MAG TPA: ABC transporter substrate-binding protein [Acetobacteraceae bacterium]|nr:ABC transporter substrate-binding protein [Acetobacteraceae bacterium]
MRSLLVLLLLLAVPARAADHVAFGIDWLAEAEYGGYYQAKATGIYAKHGLDVDIRQGGPQVNQTQLLLAGRLDFSISSNSFLALNFVQQQIPFLAVAAMFQKDPSILLAHPGAGNDNFVALRGKPIMIGADTRAGWWNFLREKFGYSDAQIRPYTFSLAPFLADKNAIQQGFLGSEPFLVRQQGGFDPVVLSIADAGFAGYASLIATSAARIKQNPDLVQRFVTATAEGWHSYLDGDPAPGNAAIKQANPDMTDALLAYGRNALKTHGVVEGGDAATGGIGVMTDARWADFFHSMVKAKLYPADLDYRAAYTLRFVGQPH